jgi:hypothetical protein
MSFPLARATSTTYSAGNVDAKMVVVDIVGELHVYIQRAPWPNTQLVSSFVSCCSLQEAGRGGHGRPLVVTCEAGELSRARLVELPAAIINTPPTPSIWDSGALVNLR